MTGTNFIRCLSSGRFAERQEHIGFGVHDAKGREIGAEIKTWRIVFSVSEIGPDHALSHLVGHEWFVMQTKSARGGKRFGPYQDERYFATETERTNAINEYLKGARRRAVAK